jgi:hypothetical protein
VLLRAGALFPAAANRVTVLMLDFNARGWETPARDPSQSGGAGSCAANGALASLRGRTDGIGRRCRPLNHQKTTVSLTVKITDLWRPGPGCTVFPNVRRISAHHPNRVRSSYIGSTLAGPTCSFLRHRDPQSIWTIRPEPRTAGIIHTRFTHSLGPCGSAPACQWGPAGFRSGGGRVWLAEPVAGGETCPRQPGYEVPLSFWPSGPRHVYYQSVIANRLTSTPRVARSSGQ